MKKQRASGIALLEGAVCSALLLSILLGGLSLWQYAQLRSTLGELAVKHLAEIPVTSPYEVRADASGSLTFELNAGPLAIALDRAIIRAKDELQARIGRVAEAKPPFTYLEACFGVFQLDSNGQVNHCVRLECPRKTGDSTLAGARGELREQILTRARAESRSGWYSRVPAPVTHTKTLVGFRIAVPINLLLPHVSVILERHSGVVHDEILELRGDVS